MVLYLHLVGRDPLKLGSLAETLQASYTLGDVQEPALFARVSHDCGEQLKSISRLKEADFLTDFRVNALAPSLVNTPLAAKLLAHPQTAEQIAQLHPLQRIGPDPLEAQRPLPDFFFGMAKPDSIACMSVSQQPCAMPTPTIFNA